MVFLWSWALAVSAFGAVEARPSPKAHLINTGAWSADLPLDAGAQTLETRAAHPSGRFVATATSEFTVSVPLVAIASAHDAEGNVTSRTFGDGRVQTLTWDAFNRLVRVTERDTSLHGYDWSAIYDGLGRRLRTVHQPVVAGAASGAPTLIDSLYDPEHEFLEIAVIVNGEPAWKVHGPDLDGRHGGWNGTGGLEAVLTPNPESANGGFRVKAILADVFGNVIATVAGQGSGQRVDWLATRVGGYGPLPNHRAELLTSPLRLAEASAWRNRRVDPTGFFWLGARYYEPHTGRFLSPDPYGHGSDLSLYAFANGDPVNRFDPDGRFGKDIWGNPYPPPLAPPGWAERIGNWIQGWFYGALSAVNVSDPTPNYLSGMLEAIDRRIYEAALQAEIETYGYDGINYQRVRMTADAFALAVGEVFMLPRIGAPGSIGSGSRVWQGEVNLTQPIGELRAAGLKDAHHVIQDAAVRNLPGYNSRAAPGVQLPGPSTTAGTPHNIATQVQRQAGGGTYAAERAIGYKALRRSGYSEAETRKIIAEADAYFRGIGVTEKTPTRIPGNR